MKLAIIYDSPIPDKNFKSANDRRVFNIRMALLKGGFESDILIPVWRSNTENIANSYTNKDGILIVGKRFKISFYNRLYFYYSCIKTIKKNKYNSVLFYNSIWDSSILIIALKILKIKSGLEICDKHSENLITKDGLNNWLKRIFIILPTEIFLNHLTDYNIVINNALLNTVSKKKPTLVLPILVDNEYFKFNNKTAKEFRVQNNFNNDDIIIMFCGSYWYYEGSELLLKAVKKISLNPIHRNFKLVFVGGSNSNKFKPDLISLTDKYDLNSFVCFTGKLTEEKLLAAFSATNLFVLPQKKDGFTDYAFPTIIGEYASMGKPIIASQTGELDLIFNDCENILFFENLDVDGLALKIELLINNPILREKLGKNARVLSEEKFGLKSNAKLLFDFFTKTLN